MSNKNDNRFLFNVQLKWISDTNGQLTTKTAFVNTRAKRNSKYCTHKAHVMIVGIN
jgi:hypothetical protein